jgi:hypothetical protein
MAPFIPDLSTETTSDDDEILVGDALIIEACDLGPEPDEATLTRSRKRFYRLVSEVPPAHRLVCFKEESGQWACRRGTVKAWRAARQLWLAEQERKAFEAAGFAITDVCEAPAELTPDEDQALAALPEAARPLFLAFYRRKSGGEVAQKAA